eukprot:jgi/Mesvir1/18412/Mv14284-RA.3
MTEEEDDWIALGGESDEDNAGAGFEEYGEQDQNPATASDSAGLEPLAEDISNAGASIASLRDASLAYPGTDRGRNADNSSDSSDSDSDGAPRRKRGRLERERTDQQQEAPEEEAQGKELKPDEKKPDDKLPTSTDAGSAGKGPGKEGSGTGTSKQGGAASGRQAAVAANATPATAGRGSKRPHRGGPAFGPTPAGRGPGGPPFHARAAPPQAMGPQQGRWRPNFIGGSPQRGPIRPPVPANPSTATHAGPSASPSAPLPEQAINEGAACGPWAGPDESQAAWQWPAWDDGACAATSICPAPSRNVAQVG